MCDVVDAVIPNSQVWKMQSEWLNVFHVPRHDCDRNRTGQPKLFLTAVLLNADSYFAL